MAGMFVVLVLDDCIHHPVGRCGPRCPSIAAANPGGWCQERKKQRRTASETGDHSRGGFRDHRRIGRRQPTPTDPASYARVRLTPRKRLGKEGEGINFPSSDSPSVALGIDFKRARPEHLKVTGILK
ncbi:hypothetical protein B296_00039161 [Ensete ventricosum]|uniref:Uncharacterized protein n=1 Tax=Ensete ventricosum TaxID=4639 RepID=A0A426X5Z1_ENSVE|nr:hypothetical protein B296_00039161 [Ensete ventricosum]